MSSSGQTIQIGAPPTSTKCPAAIRTCLTKGDMGAARAQAVDFVTGMGFDIEDVTAGPRLTG